MNYAPGVVLKITNSANVLIRFYDGFESVVNKEDIYKIPLVKFEHDVDNITNLENRWIGQTVIARNPFTYVYELGLLFATLIVYLHDCLFVFTNLGKIKERIGNGRQYAIEWSEKDKVSIQTANHIFGRYTHKPMIVVNDYILAATKNNIYLPGRVIGTKGDFFRVKFVDGIV